MDTQRKPMSPLKEHVPTALCCPWSRGAHETHYTFPGYAPVGLLRRSTPSLRGYLMLGHTHSSRPSIQDRTRLFRAYRASRLLWASARSSSSVRDWPTSSPAIGPPTSPSDLLFHHLPVTFSPCSFPYRMTLIHLFSPTHPGLPLSSHRVFPLPSSL